MATKFTYTETELAEIVKKYKAAVSLELLAAEYGKSVPSIRMKLVKLGVYEKQAPTAGESDREMLARYHKALAEGGEAPF